MNTQDTKKDSNKNDENSSNNSSVDSKKELRGIDIIHQHRLLLLFTLLGAYLRDNEFENLPGYESYERFASFFTLIADPNKIKLIKITREMLPEDEKQAHQEAINSAKEHIRQAVESVLRAYSVLEPYLSNMILEYQLGIYK